mmetsp:Transcript_2389/g.6929  ORF Transcript_2389/g.6929 Transcript_2389/m.6929 type:complete len:208 (+) Transcript_2389:2094-2717(+)
MLQPVQHAAARLLTLQEGADCCVQAGCQPLAAGADALNAGQDLGLPAVLKPREALLADVGLRQGGKGGHHVRDDADVEERAKKRLLLDGSAVTEREGQEARESSEALCHRLDVKEAAESLQAQLEVAQHGDLAHAVSSFHHHWLQHVRQCFVGKPHPPVLQEATRHGHHCARHRRGVCHGVQQLRGAALLGHGGLREHVHGKHEACV